MKNKSLSVQLALIFSMLLISFFSPVQVSASDETVDIVIHKQLRDKAPDNEIQNTVEEMKIAGNPLVGVGFTTYDVTDAYSALVKQGKSQTAVIKEISTNESTYKTNVVRAEQKTNHVGQTIFEKLPLKNSEGKDKVYMFIETSTPEGVTITEKAVPIILIMPVYKMLSNGNFSDEKLSTVHVYPKDIGFIPEEPKEPDKPDEPDVSKVPNKDKLSESNNPKLGDPGGPSKPQLPQTGEAKIFLGLLGILLIGLSVFLWEKRSKTEKEFDV